MAGCTSSSGGGTGGNADPIDRFAPCPDSPNCVSSYATDEQHAIDPLPLPEQNAMTVLREIVASFPRTTVVTQEDDYLHVIFRSRVFRFPDDVEFLIDRAAGVIQVRSASRLGYGDMGVNRNRVESIRNLLRERLDGADSEKE